MLLYHKSKIEKGNLYSVQSPASVLTLSSNNFCVGSAAKMKVAAVVKEGEAGIRSNVMSKESRMF